MTKKMIVWGDPIMMVEDRFPEHEFEYIDRLNEVGPDIDWFIPEDIQNALIALAKHGAQMYLGRCAMEKAEAQVLADFLEKFPDFLIDEGLELLNQQIGGEVNNPEQFENVYLDALELFNEDEKVVFAQSEDEDTAVFHAPNRTGQSHTIKWCEDGAIEIDGAILRPTAIMGMGYFHQALLGKTVQRPNQVAAFVARRLALNGVEDLVGYGRAFGPGKEDHTNATLSARSRQFRSRAVVGVVTATMKRVTKTKPKEVVKVAQQLHQDNPGVPVFLHQQCKEIYFGQEALEAFRGVQDGDNITLYGKSTKHTRVDAGSYCLYTHDEDAVWVPALLGMFEESNDGMVYAPKDLLNDVHGYLKETVKAVKDFQSMNQELVSRYYDTVMHAREGERIEPGVILFEVDGIPHTWDTKADYGIIRKVIDEASTQLVHIEVEIDAYFEGDIKLRGFGKGLVAPAEAAGIKASFIKDDHLVSDVPCFIIGVPGIVKDSAAAKAAMRHVEPVVGIVTTQYNSRDYELVKTKHQIGLGGNTKEYPEVGVTLEFNDKKLTVTTTDTHAMIAEVQMMIEAAPVGQAVGSSSMTLPQMAWLSSFYSGNYWLREVALPGITRRINSLQYLHAVANGMTYSTLSKES